MNVVLLGHRGMLGHMVKKYFLFKHVRVKTTDYRWPDKEFIRFIKQSDEAFLINCIGCIPQKNPNWNDYKSINILLPKFISENFKGKIIHPTTDCEFNGNIGVHEYYSTTDIPNAIDDYGISKSYISMLLKGNPNVKQIRTSIIGPELNNHVSLFDWFLLNKEYNIYGYTNHFWNGITTLEWAKQTFKIIDDWEKYKNFIQIGTEKTTKYKMLCKINDTFKLNKNVVPLETHYCNKCLTSDFELLPLDEQLLELKRFIDTHYASN